MKNVNSCYYPAYWKNDPKNTRKKTNEVAELRFKTTQTVASFFTKNVKKISKSQQENYDID